MPAPPSVPRAGSAGRLKGAARGPRPPTEKPAPPSSGRAQRPGGRGRACALRLEIAQLPRARPRALGRRENLASRRAAPAACPRASGSRASAVSRALGPASRPRPGRTLRSARSEPRGGERNQGPQLHGAPPAFAGPSFHLLCTYYVQSGAAGQGTRPKDSGRIPAPTGLRGTDKFAGKRSHRLA